MKNKLILLIVIIFIAAFPAFSAVKTHHVEWAAKVNGDIHFYGPFQQKSGCCNEGNIEKHKHRSG